MGSIRGGGAGNNSDFQSELLRMNGSLQSSITELRYHCEVYRLSLRSICKVLVSVQKEQDARLRYLTTTRPSFHAYLLNLSQKQALDRIRNVVRKASTFINGYSLVDKELFQPPPPKPSTVRRTVSCDESMKTAPAPNTSKLTDGLGRGSSEGYSGGGNIGAVGILAVIAEEDEGEASANKMENDGAETASSKNNNGKVERKHRSSSRMRQGGGGEERKKKTSESSSKKSKSRSTKSKKSHGHSSAGSEDGEIKKHGSGSNSDDESNDDDYNKPSKKEIKRRRREKKKVRSKIHSSSNHCVATATLDNADANADSTNIKQKDRERKKLLKQTRSQSITPTTRSHDNHRYHRHRHQVINSRTLANRQEEAQLDDENVNKDTSFAASVELNKRYHKQQGTLMSQSKNILTRIPSLFSISTSKSTVSSVVAMRRNKTSATSFLVSEKFTADARRGGGGLGIRRPSSENQLGRRVGSSINNMKNAKCVVEKDCRSQNQSNRNISAICMKERYESKTTRVGTTARRWGIGTSTLTAFKAGYKVRESLAVVRNRNNDGSITSHQGQGGVGAARRYLFSHRPAHRNNFKLSSVCSSAIVTDKVRRIQVNGNCGRNSFCGGINEDKVYGATRKSVSSGGGGGGTGSSNSNVGEGSGIYNKA